MQKLSFEPLFAISGPVKIIPDSVTVTGTPEDLKSVKEWKTERIEMAGLSSSVSAKILLSSPKENIDLIPQQVRVEIPVHEFTEKIVEVPLNVINNQGNDLSLLPEKVKVTFLVSLSDYPKIEKDSFEATVDFKGWMEYKYPQLPVKFKKFPAYTKFIKVEPQVVDFIIQE